jgi:hypothetical protein
MAKRRALDVEQELLEVFKQNGLVNEYLVKVLPAALWRMNLWMEGIADRPMNSACQRFPNHDLHKSL